MASTNVTTEENIPTIHTLKTDAATAWTHERKTILDLAAANENHKTEQPLPNPHSALRIFGILVGVFFVLVLGYGTYWYLHRPEPINIPPRPTPILSGDADATIALVSEDPSAFHTALRDLQKTRLAEGALREVSVSFGSGAAVHFADRETLLRLAELRLPQELTAVLTPRATLLLHYGKEDGIVLIFETTDARSALAGLLAWEDSLLPGFATAFRTRAPTSAYTFKDVLTKNVDTRIAVTESGERFGGHFILSGKTVIVASSHEALIRTLDRALVGPMQ